MADVGQQGSCVLFAMAKHMNSQCGREVESFLSCKQRDPNPETCLPKGDDVRNCANKL